MCYPILVTSPASVDEIETNVISIYPNPTNDIVTITHSFENEVIIELYDSDGRMVLKQLLINSQTEIDISNLATGIYSVNIISEDGIITKKLIKM